MTATGAGACPRLIHRAAVDFDTPHTRAASRTEPPRTAIVKRHLAWPPKQFSLRPGARQARLDSFAIPALSNSAIRAEDVHLELSDGRRRVDSLGCAT
jgi:hypothetical protein